MKMAEQHCSSCKFSYPGKKRLFFASKEESFECHRFPVMAGFSGGIASASGVWPIVTEPPFWCGEWKKEGT
jgi:hypothetical protein